jgi:hypothetical protein
MPEDDMTELERKTFFFDGALYNENRRKFPAEELWKHAGQHVAFSLDGTRSLRMAAITRRPGR